MTKKFSKRHYVAITKVLRTTTVQNKEDVINALTKLFEEDNPRFKAHKFYYMANGITLIP